MNLDVKQDLVLKEEVEVKSIDVREDQELNLNPGQDQDRHPEIDREVEYNLFW
jgi:hypothetical protein